MGASLAVVVLTGCATGGNSHPDDPLEGYNRAMFSFNETVDKAVMKPLAQGYDYVTPKPIKVGVGNFFGNLADVWIGVNNLLQGKVRDALSDAGRFLLNSTVGLAGIFDVATDVGLEKHDEDFGQTLGKWGVGEGGYFVVPILGPRTIRDALALPVDFKADPLGWLEDVASRNVLYGVRAVQDRYTLLGVEKTLDEGTLDKYTYSRDYYLQQRRYRVFDGRPPRSRNDDEAVLTAPDASLEATASAAVQRLDLAALDLAQGAGRPNGGTVIP
ncbi:MAG: VacJ family lipoprotein [Zoogloeaceae bacterium]|nr:VacJ family lipoprotein [Zoogloeaceae bacterium]